MSVYIVNFSQTLNKCLIMVSPEPSSTATIEGNVIDFICVGELEIHTVLAYLWLAMCSNIQSIKYICNPLIIYSIK